MIIKKFLNNFIKEDGFELETSSNKVFVIGNPKKIKPLRLKLLSKSIELKLLLFPDFYFGKGYVDGEKWRLFDFGHDLPQLMGYIYTSL